MANYPDSESGAPDFGRPGNKTVEMEIEEDVCQDGALTIASGVLREHEFDSLDSFLDVGKPVMRPPPEGYLGADFGTFGSGGRRDC